MKCSLPFLLLLFCLSSFQVFSQSSKKYSYLLVRIKPAYDPPTFSDYFKLEPEINNSKAGFINALAKYTPKQRAANAAAFYPSQKDTAAVYFNYFTSISAALDFLDERGWQLFSIRDSVYGHQGAPDAFTTYFLRKEME